MDEKHGDTIRGKYSETRSNGGEGRVGEKKLESGATTTRATKGRGRKGRERNLVAGTLVPEEATHGRWHGGQLDKAVVNLAVRAAMKTNHRIVEEGITLFIEEEKACAAVIRCDETNPWDVSWVKADECERIRIDCRLGKGGEGGETGTHQQHGETR